MITEQDATIKKSFCQYYLSPHVYLGFFKTVFRWHTWRNRTNHFAVGIVESDRWRWNLLQQRSNLHWWRITGNYKVQIKKKKRDKREQKFLPEQPPRYVWESLYGLALDKSHQLLSGRTGNCGTKGFCGYHEESVYGRAAFYNHKSRSFCNILSAQFVAPPTTDHHSRRFRRPLSGGTVQQALFLWKK